VLRARAARAVAVVTAIAAVTAALGGSAGAKKGTAGSVPTMGGSITYGLEAETGGGWCLPQAQLAISGIEVASAIYDTLTVPNTKGQYVPYLAKSVTHDPTYLQWTITLRDGIKFHDGEPLNADAVKLNIDQARHGRLLGFVLTNIADVTVVDNLTVRVTAVRPWVDFDAFLFLDGRAGIAAPAQLNNPDTCAKNMIGTGPFMFINGGHWIENQELVVVRNPNYWQKDSHGQQLPYLDKITFRPVVDATQRVNQLESGQLDVLHTSSALQWSTLKSLGSQVNLMVQQPGRREVRYYLLNTASPPFDDPNARKAVAMAVDRKQMNQIRNKGLFQVADGPFDKDVPGYVKDPGFPKHDLAGAKQLVDAYKAAHGGQFSVVLETTNDPENSQEAQLLKEQLSKASIDATLQIEDQTALINTALSGKFSILLWRNHPGDDPDTQYVWWYKGSPINFGKFDDPQFQGLLDQGRSTADAEQRAQVYEQIDKEFASQVYNVWAWYVTWVIAAKPNVQGLAGPPLPDGGGSPLFIYGRHPVTGIWIKK
jgi:peptide/nickel transport system substrate-binding protein